MREFLPKHGAGMRAIDTNIIVRLLTRDDPVEAERAEALINHTAVFVPRTVVLETEWVLRGVYGYGKGAIIGSLRLLAGLPNVVLEDAALVGQALELAEAGVDLADAMHLAASHRCDALITFDKRFARRGSKAGRIPVSLL